MGGAKIKDKILVLENLIDQADRIMCIGGMAYTFLKVSQGMAIGSSLFDKKGAEMVPRPIEKAKAKGCEAERKKSPLQPYAACAERSAAAASRAQRGSWAPATARQRRDRVARSSLAGQSV